MDDRKNPFGQIPPYQQSYGQQGQTPMCPQPYEQQRLTQNALDQTKILTQSGFKPLNKEELAESARIALEASFSYDGYQVVRREFFSHKFDPTLTIKGNCIIFNNACISKLEGVVYVQVLVNPLAEKLVIRPCAAGARDAIRWCIAKEEKRKSRQITCGMFTAKLYNMMGWEALYRYKLQGSTLNLQNEEIYIFDLTSTEAFLPAVTDSSDPDAKPKCRPPQYPKDWADSFGLTVKQHTESTQIDLMEGYRIVDVKEKERPEMEQMPMEMLDRETGEVTKV